VKEGRKREQTLIRKIEPTIFFPTASRRKIELNAFYDRMRAEEPLHVR
jgi:hypothetical protein